MDVKQLLGRVPADRMAEERAWEVVRSAYLERDVVPRRRGRRRWALASVAVAAVCAAAAFSPPGRAVVDAVRRTIGIEHAAPALFRLPTSGRLLVSGRGGTWVVAPDGSKRRLGGWTQASWSPHGLFVVGVSTNGLAAVEPTDGIVRWSLGRPRVGPVRWGGTRIDTRLAYLSGSTLRVVAGDGTGDRLLARRATHVAPVWQTERHVLAYATPSRSVVVRNVDTDAILATHSVSGTVRALAWSADRRRLAVATTRDVEVFGTDARRLTLRLPGVQALAFGSNGELALLTAHALVVYGTESAQTVLRVQGRLAGLAWSPDARWLVTALPGADQWVFVGRRGRVLAVSHIARQFGGGAPALDGWVSGA